MIRLPFIIARLVGTLCIAVCMTSYAETTTDQLRAKNDRSPVTITAEQAEIDGLASTTTYNGQVTMEKGAMSIEADAVVFRELEGTTTYSGNVVVIMEVDSARIEAEQVIIHSNKRQVSKITALGTPARYQQKPRGESNLVVAKANTLEYQLDNETLHLIENASLEQDGSSLSGNQIDYDVRASVVKAGSSVDQKERVHMVIPPRAFKREDDKVEAENNTPPEDNPAEPPKDDQLTEATRSPAPSTHSSDAEENPNTPATNTTQPESE